MISSRNQKLNFVKEARIDITVEEVSDFFKEADIRNIIFNQDVLDLIKKLKKKYIVGLASNVSEGLGKRLNEMKSYQIFDTKYRFLSYEIGLAKRSEEFFYYILKKLNAVPEEAIFIDDRVPNIAIPNIMGMHGILYKNAGQLISDLKLLNIDF